MARYCVNCGAEIQEGVRFCPSCGATLQDEISPSSIPTQPVSNTPNEPISTGPNMQSSQQYTPPIRPKKSKGKIFGIILLLIIVVAVVVVLFFVFTGGSDGRFVGEWEQDTGSGTYVSWVFKSDGTLEVGSMGMTIPIGDWSIKGNQLCVDVTYYSGVFTGDSCVSYEFSNGGNTLTLTQSGVPITLTKK